jgi:hypothetical protein
MTPKLTANQLEQVSAVVRRQLRYLGRLRDRLNAVGFVPDDTLMRETMKAYDAVHGLNVTLHYDGCEAFRRERGT